MSIRITHVLQQPPMGGSRLLKRGAKARLIIINFDVGLAGICTVIVCEAHGHVKHANTRGSGGMPP